MVAGRECEMNARLRRITLRDAALFALVTAAVAVSTVCGAQELGLDGERAEAVSQADVEQQTQAQSGQEEGADPLILTLTPEADYCETERASESWGIGSGGVRLSAGWVVSAEIGLQWNVTGGEAPYTLEIDGESEDAFGQRYSGAAGRATAPCVDTSVSWRWGRSEGGAVRLYRSDPQIDSGWTSVRAKVTDANGDTAEATARFYVLLDLGGGSSGEILTRGETYRVNGVLMTAPEGYDLTIGGYDELDCPENDPNPRCGEALNTFGLVGVDAWISLYEEDGELDSRRPEADGSGGPAGAAGDELTAAVDALVDSLGKLPTAEGN